jgi:hypothetical protein
LVHEPAIEQRGGAVFVIGLVYPLCSLWDIREDGDLNFSVQDCRINIQKGLDFVALCGLGNTLVFSRIGVAVADDPDVLREAADATSKKSRLAVGAPTEKVHAGDQRVRRRQGCFARILIKELSHSTRNCQFP